MKLGMVFPGQGSQSVGMLKGYAGLPEIDAVRAEAAAVLGADFLTILDDGPSEQLNLTLNTQPAMLSTAIAAYRAWRALGGMAPAVVAGHSLGEYSALVAADSLALGDALRLVRFRALSMQEAVPEGQGAMAAILGLDADAARAACAEVERGGEAVQAVNFNAPGQVVIAGDKSAVARAIEACKARGAKRAMLLPVSAPFHSTLMQPAAAKLACYMEKIALLAPTIPLVNNVDVRQETDPLKIKDALVRQAASPVRWVETIRSMAAQGVTHVLECGPGRVLAGLVKRIEPKLQGIAAADRASLELALATIKGG
ncbi:MAG: [acyl-carrier-protein] S-malonyltransferase [Betaproteobacteria bacterium]|nr:[acyl-carrier-protein] S-malonyltransferase [Betaproteobacteria bacterium]MSQ88749.1 [acyl-carrier-protein] S-malonyltransferase [Betaproteobacteria bacterium]